MADHLPECFTISADPVPAVVCICPALRACEARVREDERSNNFTPDDHADAMTEAYQRGVQAARDAVAALPKGGMGLKAHALWRDALAAIDALRSDGSLTSRNVRERMDERDRIRQAVRALATERELNSPSEIPVDLWDILSIIDGEDK